LIMRTYGVHIRSARPAILAAASAGPDADEASA
jgi:hypothetical protein